NRHFDHRRDESRGYAMTRDIRHYDSQATGLSIQEIVEVACDRSKRSVAHCYVQALYLRDRARQDRALDLFPGAHVLGKRKEFLFIGQDALDGNVAEGADKEKEAVRLVSRLPNRSRRIQQAIMNERKEIQCQPCEQDR